MSQNLYLDHAASTYPYKEAIAEALVASRDFYGNPSSGHPFGARASAEIRKARRKCANLINAKESEIIFTSGGTEANNFALFGVLRPGDHLITSAIEHHSILNACKELEKRGIRVTYVPVSNNGIVKLKRIKKAISNDTKMISIMSANNEIGTLQPIQKISEIAHEHGLIFHTDAVQAVGHLEMDVEKFGIDMLSASGHKFHSLKGTGFLYVNKKLYSAMNERISPIIFGGGQESGLRAGTENVPGIVSMGVAAEIAKKNISDGSLLRVKKIRDYIQNRITEEIPFSIVNGELNYRLATILSVGFRFVDSGVLINALCAGDDKIYVSGKSACTSANAEPSHVLKAINLDKDYINGTIRISLDESMDYKKADFFVDKLAETVKMLRNYNSEYMGK